MRVMLTGESGVLGKHVLANLLKNYEVTGTSRSEVDDFKGQYDWKPVDLSKTIDEKLLEDVGAEIIVHMGAATDPSLPEEMIDTINVQSTIALANFCAKNGKKFIFISGGIVYENVYGKALKETDAKTKGDFGGNYGLSKWKAEKALEELEFNICVLRPSSIYGHGMADNKLMGKLASKVRKTDTLDFKPPYENEVNLIHALDVAEVVEQVIEQDIKGTFNIAFEKSYSLKDMLKTSIEINPNVSIEWEQETTKTESSHLYDLDCSLAKKTFGFAPQIDFAKGLKMMVEERIE